jgi:hypothetical protein
MSSIEELQLVVFQDELQKIGAPAWMAGLKALRNRVGGAVGSGVGAGVLGGGTLGAGVGGVRDYVEAKRQGATTGQAVGAGLGGALSGGYKGLLMGGAAGGLAGGIGAARGIAPGMAKKLTEMRGPVGAFARSGQRNVHGLTGWTPKGGISSIRGGSYAAREAKKSVGTLRQVREAAEKADPSLLQRMRGMSPEEVRRIARSKGEAKVRTATKGVAAARKAERMGLTSLPGYAKSMREHGVGKTLATGFKEQWHAGGPLGKAMALYPGYEIGQAALGKGEPGGPGRAERVGRSLGSLAFATPLPALTAMAAAGGISSAGGAAGKGIGKLRRKKKPLGQNPAAPSLQSEGTEAVERHYTPAALGQAPEGILG